MKVYVLTHWYCGYGGDDEREILGVFSTREQAEAWYAHDPGVDIEEVELDAPARIPTA